MSQANIKKSEALKAALPDTAVKVTTPWACRHDQSGSSIDAYVAGMGEWMTIAHIPTATNIDTKAIAEQIIRAVNSAEKNQEIMSGMASALRICLECDGIDWAAESDADIMLRRYEALTER